MTMIIALLGFIVIIAIGFFAISKINFSFEDRAPENNTKKEKIYIYNGANKNQFDCICKNMENLGLQEFTENENMSNNVKSDQTAYKIICKISEK